MNLHKMLRISEKIAHSLERGEAVAAISCANLADYTFAQSALESAIGMIKQSCCLPAVLYVSRGQMCVDDSADAVLLAKADSVGLAQLPLALARGDTCAVQSDAAVMMASLVGIRVVSSGYLFANDEQGAEACISALRAYPTLLCACAHADALAALSQRSVPAYRANMMANNNTSGEYVSFSEFAQICRVKWDIGLTSGVAAICDYEANAHGAYMLSAKIAAQIAVQLSKSTGA